MGGQGAGPTQPMFSVAGGGPGQFQSQAPRNLNYSMAAYVNDQDHYAPAPSYGGGYGQRGMNSAAMMSSMNSTQGMMSSMKNPATNRRKLTSDAAAALAGAAASFKRG